MSKDFEESVRELVRSWRERTYQSLKLAARAESVIRQCQNAKFELENGWLYFLMTILVIGIICIAKIR